MSKDTSKKEHKSKIRITGLKKAASKIEKYTDEKILNKLLQQEIIFEFDTTILWANTMISSILFTEKSIKTLDTFLKEQNLKPITEQDGEIPEIGGILLGRPFFSKKRGQYRVLVEEFVPISPEYNDKYKLTFSTHSLSKDLGDIQDQFSEIALIGWFHTHPGHGLFLSRPDLNIHDSFFKELYQFAMEIDSLSTRLDTGFFTRRKDGKVNNRKDLITSTWYSWLDADNSD